MAIRMPRNATATMLTAIQALPAVDRALLAAVETMLADVPTLLAPIGMVPTSVWTLLTAF